MKIPKAMQGKGFRQFIVSAGILALCFIIISFVIGGVIVPGPLLYTLWFFVYGGLGYIALAMMLFFVVYTRDKLMAIKPFNKGAWYFWPITVALVAAFYMLGTYVKMYPELLDGNALLYGAALHALFLAIFLSLGFAIFSIEFVKRFLKDFKKELIVCLLIGAAFYGSMRFVWKLWPYLSWGVSKIVYQMLRVFPGDPLLVPPQSIHVGSFAVYIGEACSGVFSIFLFTSLYLLIIALDWHKLNHTKAIGLFFAAIAGLYLVNVLRVYLIIIVGALLSPELAANLFHSYIGMILFMAYFALFMWACFDWMKK